MPLAIKGESQGRGRETNSSVPYPKLRVWSDLKQSRVQIHHGNGFGMDHCVLLLFWQHFSKVGWKTFILHKIVITLTAPPLFFPSPEMWFDQKSVKYFWLNLLQHSPQKGKVSWDMGVQGERQFPTATVLKYI